MIEFMGRFIEKNPGKTLFAGSATAVVLHNAERLLGGDELVVDKDGNVTVVSRPGLMGRMGNSLFDRIISPILYVLLPIVAIGSAAWMAIKLYFTYRREHHLASVSTKSTKTLAAAKKKSRTPSAVRGGGEVRAGDEAL